eukprot:TRINITY_DN492_c0_g1_i3.p1 TRINITY_DN492_c0_g1~~TRINITY_DN492_c0_g1_i3.p1  ORF type:complete len:187 (+),score=23.34 TRINITY_DN492_c0_g1_i3:103-663(+)
MQSYFFLVFVVFSTALRDTEAVRTDQATVQGDEDEVSKGDRPMCAGTWTPDCSSIINHLECSNYFTTHKARPGDYQRKSVQCAISNFKCDVQYSLKAFGLETRANKCRMRGVGCQWKCQMSDRVPQADLIVPGKDEPDAMQGTPEESCRRTAFRECKGKEAEEVSVKEVVDLHSEDDIIKWIQKEY